MKATPGSSRTDDRGARWLRFTRSAKRHPLPKSGLDYTDELTGQILAATPKDTVVALYPDRGFIPVERTIHPPLGTVPLNRCQ